MGMARVSRHSTHPSGSTAGEDPLASAQEPRQNAKEMGPRFKVLPLERGVTTAPSDSLLPRWLTVGECLPFHQE